MAKDFEGDFNAFLKAMRSTKENTSRHYSLFVNKLIAAETKKAHYKGTKKDKTDRQHDYG